MPGGDRRRNPYGAERLAVLARQSRHPAQCQRRARHRVRPAADLCQSGRRPGRTGVRRRLLRAQRRSFDRIPAAGVPRNGRDDAWSRIDGAWRCAKGPIAAAEEPDQADYTACMLGLRDYVGKNRFKGVVLGLSGGIDSALCAAMAVDALGAERVRCVMLPFRFTSQESLDDAAAIAKRSACSTTLSRSRAPCTASKRRSRASLPVRRAMSPRRICRRAPAARS